jgi:hypothetical protein
VEGVALLGVAVVVKGLDVAAPMRLWVGFAGNQELYLCPNMYLLLYYFNIYYPLFSDL